MDKTALHTRQLSHAERAKTVVIALAKVGIIGLIDEATGYQYQRERNALEVLLQNYLTKTATKWLKRFPNEYYEQMARLRGWDMKSIQKGNRPSVVGKYTNDLIYDRLAPSLVDSLDRINPQSASGSRSKKHHQHLQDPAVLDLTSHISAIVTMMTLAKTWDAFMETVNRLKPKFVAETETA